MRSLGSVQSFQLLCRKKSLQYRKLLLTSLAFVSLYSSQTTSQFAKLMITYCLVQTSTGIMVGDQAPPLEVGIDPIQEV